MSQGTTSSFPHAFERWETLSSHWEGLTSYWIRKLEANTEELQRQPLMAQLSRQVTDLSAAGANLFHAVVELQRLRASSERKFQRWFFESRKEQERQQELSAQLEDALLSERSTRAVNVNEIQSDLEHAKRAERNALTLVAEIKRELQISKDEARRAWEELGRREQEERERTIALREGNPIVIGGVQVFPTVQGESRRASVAQQQAGRDGEQEVYEGEPSPSNTDPFIEEGPPRPQLHHEPDDLGQRTQQQQYRPGNDAARMNFTPRTAAAEAPDVYQPTSTGPPFRPTPASSSPQTSSQPAAVLATTSAAAAAAAVAATNGQFYQHGGTYLHNTSQPEGADQRSYVGSVDDTFSENDDEYEMDHNGNILVDAQGRPIPVHQRRALRSDGSDDFDVADDIEHEKMLRQQYGRTAVQYPAIPALSSSGAAAQAGLTPSSRPTQPTSNAPDYSGEGYDESWDNRHYHPSRLSDVIEEDERSRISEMSHGARSTAESMRGAISTAPF